MSQVTDHGENIVQQIQGEDAYGRSGPLTNADVWLILDSIHSSMIDVRESKDPIFSVLETGMRQLEEVDSELPPL